MLRGDSHPTISLMADADLILKGAGATLPSEILSTLQSSLAAPHGQTKSQKLSNEALRAVMDKVKEKYKYRLPDATGRKDIEYYRDPAHRGYLAYTIKQGESPSLFFKPPGEAKDRKKVEAKKLSAKASADNRLF